MTDDRSNRFNVQLDDEHAARLHAVAERTCVILDSIPGAWERAQEGLAGARAERFVPLEDL